MKRRAIGMFSVIYFRGVPCFHTHVAWKNHQTYVRISNVIPIPFQDVYANREASNISMR